MSSNLRVEVLLAEGVRRLDNLPAGARGPVAPPDAIPGRTPVLDAELLLAHALGISRARLRSHPEDLADPEVSRRYFEMVARRAAGEPIAYILGFKDFWSLRLTVTPAVLVPRPETELLVERVLALANERPARVADLGTGSGAIALAIARERPAWKVVATDLSDHALSAARDNAAALDLGRIEFLRGDWFEPLAERTFDLIVSNPPYVADSDPALEDPALRYEPRMALTPGPDAMACLRAIIRSAPQHLERDGWLLLEHGATQATDVTRELVAHGFRYVRSHPDLAGHLRVTEAQRPSTGVDTPHGQI